MVIVLLIAISFAVAGNYAGSLQNKLKGTVARGYEKDGRFYLYDHTVYREVSEADWHDLQFRERLSLYIGFGAAAITFILVLTKDIRLKSWVKN